MFGAVSFKPTFDVDVKFMSRDGCVLSGVQHAPSKRDAYGVVGVKFISRDGWVLRDVQYAPSKRDAHGDVGVKFISRGGCVLCGV